MTSDSDIAAEAASWLARKDRGLNSTEGRAFEAWKAADPRNAAEFAKVIESWNLFDRTKRVSDLVEMAARLEARTRPSQVRPRWPLWTTAIAAGLALLCWFELRPAMRLPASVPAAAYRVVPTDARKLTLDDGSVVELRGGSEVRVEFTAALRRVVLVRGEAHFSVIHNPRRPFVVAAGTMAVRDIGTAFDVDLKNSQLAVLVTEGEVSVEDTSGAQRVPAVPSLRAGERVLITRDAAGQPVSATVETLASAEVEQALAWQSTWLLFDRTPLEKAVEAFNLHSTQRMVIGDDSLRDRRLGGMFRADNVEGFVRLLHESLDVKSVKSDSQAIVLLPER